MKKNLFTKLALIAVSIGMTPALQGCTDNEIAAAIAGVAIGVAVTAPTPVYPDTYCEGGYRQVCRGYTDYYGRYRQDCRQEYDACLYHRGRYYRDEVAGTTGAGAAAAAPAIEITKEATDASVAEAYNLGLEGSAKLLAALKQAQKGDAKALYDLGLSKKDLKRLAKDKMPTEQGVDNLAKNLDQSVDSTKAMLQKIADAARK